MREYEDDYLYTNEEKLHYTFEVLNLRTKEIAQTLEVSETLVSQLQNHIYKRLKKLHLFALENSYGIPLEIFENPNIQTKKQIKELLKKPLNTHQDILYKNSTLLKQLLGKWYFYNYPSNLLFTEVWEIETIFDDNYKVNDQYNNSGILVCYQNESTILFENSINHNTTVIVFDNNYIPFNTCPYARISKSHGLNKTMFNFGFFSRKKLGVETAKTILGEIAKVQLQMDYQLLERINNYIEI